MSPDGKVWAAKQRTTKAPPMDDESEPPSKRQKGDANDQDNTARKDNRWREKNERYKLDKKLIFVTAKDEARYMAIANGLAEDNIVAIDYTEMYQYIIMPLLQKIEWSDATTDTLNAAADAIEASIQRLRDSGSKLFHGELNSDGWETPRDALCSGKMSWRCVTLAR